MTRVAALQFASTTDVENNLNVCVRMIEKAAEEKPALMVLPEFCNHLSWYESMQDAWDVALEQDSRFLECIADCARRFSCYIVINVSLRRQYPEITVTSLLFAPDGQCVLESNKQTLMGHENDFFVRAKEISPVIETKAGRLALFPCRDGVTCETPRGLALRGAQIFCDSLNSFARDEASLHVPARAPENKVFLVAANKIGPLIPEHLLEPFSQSTSIPVHHLMGAGESQIVAPDGTVLSKAPSDQEAVIFADIDLNQADKKERPDGTHIFKARRPGLYLDIKAKPSEHHQEYGYVESRGKDVVNAALVRSDCCQEQQASLSAVLGKINSLPNDTEVVVLPELFWCEDSQIDDLQAVADFSQHVKECLLDVCLNRSLYIATSLVEAIGHRSYQHTGVLLGPEGCVLKQPQLHFCKRHGWSELGTEILTIDLPWGRVALMTGDDSIYPELVKVAALKGVHCLLVPFDCQETWESSLGLLSRAAENRICVAASSRATPAGTGLLASLEREFTLMTEWHKRTFDGHINYPIVTPQIESVTLAALHPNAATNKLMSANTDLLVHRPWHLSEGLASESHGKDNPL